MVRAILQRHMSVIKALVHLAIAAPLAHLAWQTWQGQLGGDPVQYLTHFTGKGALNLLFITLLVSPFAKRFKLAPLFQLRRLLGLWVMAYASVHLAIFIYLDLGNDWALLFNETLSRPYILFGMLAFAVLLALSITSHNGIRKRLGRQWQKLHNWVYLAAVLAPVHYYWSVKAGLAEAIIYLVVAGWLLFLRRQKLWAPVKKCWHACQAPKASKPVTRQSALNHGNIHKT
ncbi:protein-methionine-sulfoxide reductase heme-binding subunit MsrQ [Motilimonas pumila]|uniref:Protein-methionine-sulfoxide reductase heme-binding subunit MsrQ n=1 Tax=Motilimonas pumila TaxID=2303987 RepID=A0A418YEE5_9GAMM|nr:protein-methionine-sulfoxide reductase heme-binding subunit MsrQ [Motilimonas pumila]RJG47527.1 protein-methionine-sulfoxide reductase heme-binding subunit MsrQ [Motilimonas pumila]